MPTLEIDGQEVTVEPGTTVIEAAKQVGVEIPTFCYHPGLSIPANCRMCLVDIDMGRGSRLMPACHTHVGDGMNVNTTNQATEEARSSVLEFILLNHPVDCPICDQAGECDLQNQYFEFSAKESQQRFRKVHKPKVKELGPQIVLDAERCIMCTRCVRFCDEVTETYELRMMNRGEHTELTTFPGVELDNAYSMCTADLCPVGALTGRDFRFQARVWFTGRAQTVCDQCSNGCSMHVDTLRNEVKRLNPRENQNVNQWWACDEGRLSFKRLEEGRVEEGREGINGSSESLSASEAYQRIGKKLLDVSEESGPGSIGILVHPSWSTEDHFVTAHLAQSLGEKALVYVGGRTESGTEDNLLIKADKNANRRGMTHAFEALKVETNSVNAMAEQAKSGSLKMVLVLDGEHELSDEVLEALEQVPTVVALSALNTQITDKASLVAPTRTLFERGGTFVNEKGWIQRFRKACQGDPSVLTPWKAVGTIGQAAGLEIGYARLSEVFGELSEKVPAYQGLSLDDLGAHGLAEQGQEKS